MATTASLAGKAASFLGGGKTKSIAGRSTTGTNKAPSVAGNRAPSIGGNARSTGPATHRAQDIAANGDTTDDHDAILAQQADALSIADRRSIAPTNYENEEGDTRGPERSYDFAGYHGNSLGPNGAPKMELGSALNANPTATREYNEAQGNGYIDDVEEPHQQEEYEPQQQQQQHYEPHQQQQQYEPHQQQQQYEPHQQQQQQQQYEPHQQQQHYVDDAPVYERQPEEYVQSDRRSAATGRTGNTRPTMREEPSRSYIAPIPIVTEYETEENPQQIQRPQSATGYRNAPVAASRRTSTAGSIKSPTPRAASRAPSMRALPVASNVQPHHVQSSRPVSRAGSRAGSHDIAPAMTGVGAGAAGAGTIGEILSGDRQRELQQQRPPSRNRVSLHDQGTLPRDRSTTFDEPQRVASPRPQSSFGLRPQPNLLSVTEDRSDSRYDNGRDSRGGMLNRSGTVLSRANTGGRNGTVSRLANGGTAGSRRGAFGRGAGTTVGTQPEEVLGRDDIHTRAELSERILDDATLRRLTTMERRDAVRLSKVIRQEGKSEQQAVKGSIKELERMVKLQKEAAYAERKSQVRLGKWTSKEHRARLRFLKEKERYERVEGELRNAENDYEERRDHAAGLTSQVAEKTQDLDDLRGQKAADDREREVKLLALKNPAHS